MALTGAWISWTLAATALAWPPAQAAAILRIANAAKSWVPNPNLDGSTAFFEGAASLEGTPDQGGIILAADNPALPPAQAFCDRVHALLAEVEFLARSPALERARQAARKNDLFVKNTVDQQFPWEAAVNSRCVPATLEGPPTWQLVFGHLQGGVAVPLRGRTTVTPSVVLEGIGYERRPVTRSE